MKAITKLSVSAACSVLAACGAANKSDESSDDFVLEEQIPSDSTGSRGNIVLGLTSSFAAASALAEDTADKVIKIGDNIELSYAKLSIAKIKIKAMKEPSDKEKELEDSENTSEKETSEQLEQDLGTTAETTASLDKPDGVGKPDDAAKLSQREQKEARHARLQSKRAEFESKAKEDLDKECKRDRATKFSGPYVYDAITGTLEGEVPKVDVADGSYHRIQLQLKRNFNVGEDDPLLGQVFVIKGTVKKAEVAVPFEIDWHVALNFRLAGDSPFSVVPGEDNALTIDFNVSKWFDGIDLTTAEVDATDGTIYINKSSNREIMRQLHRNIKLGSGFGKDANRNGKLEATEVSGTGQEATDADAG